MCAKVGGETIPLTTIPKQIEVAVGKMIVAEPNPKRLPCRHTGGDAPLHSLPPLRTANRGVACCANALLEMTSIPTVIATTHANLRNIVMICLPANFGHTGLSNTTERRSLQLNLRPFPIYKHLHPAPAAPARAKLASLTPSSPP